MNNERNKKIEDILNSLDSHPKAAAPDFFYTRLTARMQHQQDYARENPTQRSWIVRPAFVFAGLATILIVNIMVLLQRTQSSPDSSNDAESIQAIAAEYRLNTESSTAMLDVNQDNR